MEQSAKQMFLKETLEKADAYYVEKLRKFDEHVTFVLDDKLFTYQWESSFYHFLNSSLSMPSLFLCYSICSQGVHSFHVEFTLHKTYRLTIDFLSNAVCFSFTMKQDAIRYVGVPFNTLKQEPIFLALIHATEHYFLKHPSFRIRLTSGCLSFSYANDILKINQK